VLHCTRTGTFLLHSICCQLLLLLLWALDACNCPVKVSCVSSPLLLRAAACCQNGSDLMRLSAANR
jgi:hypothetical protein